MWTKPQQYWTHDANAPRRRVRADMPRGTCHCHNCGERLSYEYGSIAWSCQTEDLCPSCAGKAAAERIVAKVFGK